MKRAHDGDDVSPPPKRVRRTLSIVDANLDEVKKQYRTDCEIIATNGKPVPARGSNSDAAEAVDAPDYRVFPVNHVVASGWSEPFGVMMDGQFAEGTSGRVYLPFSSNVVAAVVRHMYFTANMADAPEIAPEDAFAVMEIAHMYERMDLFALAEPSFWKVDPNLFTTLLGNNLVLRALRLGVDAKKLYQVSRKSTKYDYFTFDATDDTMKPFLEEFESGLLHVVDLLMWSDYTEELRRATMYSVYTPERWKVRVKWMEKKMAERKDERFSTRLCQISSIIASARDATQCGVMSHRDMRSALSDIAEWDDLDDDIVDEATSLLNDGKLHLTDSWVRYSALMRRVYPLPPPQRA